MTLEECYDALGGNYDEAVGRLRSERMVQKFVLKFADDKSYDLLCRSMEDGNMEEAFRACHTIKGICANLAFNNLLNSSEQLTETLRNGSKPDDKLFDKLQKDYCQVMEAIQKFKEGVEE